jgi:polysaccharide biosynthesis protein PslG
MKKISLVIVATIFISILSLSGQYDKPGKFGPGDKVYSGVNIHFTTGHEKDLDMIAAAGFKIIRMDFVWQSTEKEKGVYDWSAYDELTANLNKRGIRALYILDYSNPLYEEQTESKDPISGKITKSVAAPHNEESVAAFAKWAAAAALHFRGNNIIWEIWNEPNINFWRPAPDVEQYNKLAAATCKAIRKAVPEAIIIGPATSQLPVPFIEAFLASGITEYIDAVSVHPYRRYNLSPETVADDYNKIRELIRKYTPAGKAEIPIVSGEWGYSSSSKGVSVETQAAYIVRMQLANLVYGIPFSIWYDWKNDGPDPEEHEHNFGTVTNDLEPKPAYIAIKNMNDQLKDFTFLRRVDVKRINDFILLFRDDKGNKKIVAWTAEVPHNKILDELEISLSGITAKDWEGNELKVGTEKGKIAVNLGPFPQYISVPGR